MTFKQLFCFQALSRALNFSFKIQAFSRISQACYELWMTQVTLLASFDALQQNDKISK